MRCLLFLVCFLLCLLFVCFFCLLFFFDFLIICWFPIKWSLLRHKFTQSLTSCGQHLSTPIWFWSIKTWLDSSPALSRKDSLGRGSCLWTSFDHIWMWPRQWGIFRFPREIQQSRWSHQRPHLSSTKCHTENSHQRCPIPSHDGAWYANLCSGPTLHPTTKGKPYGQPTLPSPLPHGRFHQWADLAHQLQTTPFQPSSIHQTHPLCGQQTHLWRLSPPTTSTLWSPSWRRLLWKAHHPGHGTWPRVSWFHAWNQACGTHLPRPHQHLPGPVTIFIFGVTMFIFGIPTKVLLSGFRSRCHIVVKGAFPNYRVRQGLDQLIHLYTLAGFPTEELHTISSQILTQHQNLRMIKYTDHFVVPPFVSCCLRCSLSWFLFLSSFFLFPLPPPLVFGSNSCPQFVLVLFRLWSPWILRMVVRFTTTWLVRSCSWTRLQASFLSLNLQLTGVNIHMIHMVAHFASIHLTGTCTLLSPIPLLPPLPLSHPMAGYPLTWFWIRNLIYILRPLSIRREPGPIEDHPPASHLHPLVPGLLDLLSILLRSHRLTPFPQLQEIPCPKTPGPNRNSELWPQQHLLWQPNPMSTRWFPPYQSSVTFLQKVSTPMTLLKQHIMDVLHPILDRLHHRQGTQVCRWMIHHDLQLQMPLRSQHPPSPAR